jgi:hypothetical protein
MSEPKLFIIGDSISMHYGPYLKEMLKDKVHYGRKGEDFKHFGDINDVSEVNGGDSSCVLEYLKSIMDSGFKTDYLLLNCGLHDVKTIPDTGKIQVELDDYSKNLDKIIELTKGADFKLIWVRTTPVDDAQHNDRAGMSFFRYDKNVIEYNEVADKKFADCGAHVIDLNTFTLNLDEPLYCDHVHFNEPVRKLQAAFIAGHISSLI